MNAQYLFVYGTLQSDAVNPHAVHFHSRAKFIGKARWQGDLYLVTNYPAAVKSEGGANYVDGELWELIYPEEVLFVLDQYEECAPTSPLPHEYARSVELVEMGDQQIPAWIYLYQLSTALLERIESGLFVNDNQVLIRRD